MFQNTHRLVPLEQIVPNPLQPRRQFDEAALNELADSIRQYGVLQPVLVRHTGPECYELIAGERRFRAAKRAGLTSLPVLVKEMTDPDVAEVSLIENLQREDLSPVETARAFRTLMQQFGLTQQEIGERVNKSQSMISYLLHLLELPEEILDSLDSGKIQERHARALLRIEDETLRERIYRQIVTEGLTVRETDQLIRAERREEEPVQPVSSPLQPPPEKPVLTEADRTLLCETSETRLEAQLTQKFTRRVIIRCPDSGKGQIEIGFHDKADMLHLAGLLLDTPV